MSLERPFAALRLLRFLGPSLVGIAAFLVPIRHDGSETVLIGLITAWIQALLAPWLLGLVVAVILLSVVGGVYHLLRRPDWQQRRPGLDAICNITPGWLALRIIALVIGVMVLLEAGPELIRGDDTGAAVFTSIGVPALVIFAVACQLMPFLTEFGFMEFVGTLLARPFNRVFRLPGRSAIDATASFVSAATVGLLITIGQYERGYYTAREAAAVATNFSVVSIPFSLLVARVTGIDHIYFDWYLTVIVACLLCALVMVRLPPLASLPDEYHPDAGDQRNPEQPAIRGLWRAALAAALERADAAPGPAELVRAAWLQTLDVTFAVIPAAMTLATLAAILVFHTPVFDILSVPLVWVLEVLGLPEARAAAPGFLAGFLDQFMPALIAANIDSELTRFVLAGLSISQLIYMAEVGVLIIRSSLPLDFGQLLVIFALRTVIVLPVFLVSGAWLL